MSLIDSLGRHLLSADMRRQDRSAEPAPAAITRSAPPAPQIAPEPLAPDHFSRRVNLMDSSPEHHRLGRGNYIHVSSLAGLCARQYYLAHLYRVELTEALTGGHHVTFALGHAAEAHFMKQYLKSTQNQRIYGVWSCVCRRTRRFGLHIPQTCSTCMRPVDNYGSPVLLNQDYKIIGRPDLSEVQGTSHMAVAEIKSMARDRWEALQEPLGDHVVQALLYRWLYQMRGHRVHDAAALIYITKDFKFGSPYKEFHVDATSPISQRLVQNSLAIARQVVDARSAETAPARTRCASVGDPKARQCPVATYCFSVT